MPPDEYQLGRDIAANQGNIQALTERMARTEARMERLLERLEPMLEWVGNQMEDDSDVKHGKLQVQTAQQSARATWPIIIVTSTSGAIIAGCVLIAVRLLFSVHGTP